MRRHVILFVVLLLFPVITLAQSTAVIPEGSARLTPFYLSAQQGEVGHKLASPAAMAVTRSGNILVFDDGNSRIVKLDGSGNFLMEFGQPGSGGAQVQPGGLSDALAVDQYENVFVVNPVSPQVQIFNAEGQFVRSFRVPFAVDSIAVNRAGEIFLSVNSARPVALIYVFSNTGTFLRTIGERIIKTPGSLPRALNQTVIAFDSHDNLFVAFRSWPLIRKYSSNGKLLAESSYKIPSSLMDESRLQNYSLDFFASHPNASYALPLLAHSVAVTQAGKCYILLNGHTVVEADRNAQVTKQSRFNAGAERRLFIRLAGGSTANSLYLLDIRSASIHKMSRI
jgi:hypothetical protein